MEGGISEVSLKEKSGKTSLPEGKTPEQSDVQSLRQSIISEKKKQSEAGKKETQGREEGEEEYETDLIAALFALLVVIVTATAGFVFFSSFV